MRIAAKLIVVIIFAALIQISFSAEWRQCSSGTGCGTGSGILQYGTGCFISSNTCCSTSTGYYWTTSVCSCSVGSGFTFSSAGPWNYAGSSNGGVFGSRPGSEYTFYETPHGYSNNMACGSSGLYTCPAGSKIQFWLQLDTEAGFDFLHISNSAGTTYASLSGLNGGVYFASPVYDQNTARFSFTSDGSVSGSSGSQYIGVDVYGIKCVLPNFNIDSVTSNPASGNAPLNNVQITVATSGDATGIITYELDCFNDGTYEFSESSSLSTYTFANRCNYPNPGTWTGRVRATRESVPKEQTFSVVVNNLQPAISIVASSPDPPRQNNIATLSATVTAGSTSVTGCSLMVDSVNRGAFSLAPTPCTTGSTCPASIPYTFTDTAIHSVRADCTDSTGTYSGPQVSMQAILADPTISTVSSAPSPPVQNNPATLSATVSPGSTDVTSCNLIIDSANQGPMSLIPSPCTSGTCTISRAHTFTDIAPHTVFAQCTDSAGPHNGPSTTITAVAPTPTPTPIPTPTPTPTPTPIPTPTPTPMPDGGSCTASNQCTSGCCYVGACPQAGTCGNPASVPVGCSCRTDPSATPTPTPGGPPPPSDSTGPVTNLNPYTPDPTNDNTPTYTGNSIDTQSDVISIQYRVRQGAVTIAYNDVDPFAISPNVNFQFTTPPLADGTYTVDARATDSRGNVGPYSAPDIITIDASPPTIDSLTRSHQYPTTSDMVSITATASDSSMDRIEIFVDGIKVAECFSTSCTTSASIFSWGSHSYYAVAWDTAGSSTTSSTETFTANDPPSVNPIRVAGPTCNAGETITLECDVSDPNQADNTLTVYAWAGQCDSSNCFNTRAWATADPTDAIYYKGYSGGSSDTMAAPASGGTYTTTLLINQPVGTSIAATCQPTDTNARPDWQSVYTFGDAYPVCTVGSCTNPPTFSNIQVTQAGANTGFARMGTATITFTASKALESNPVAEIIPGGVDSGNAPIAGSFVSVSGMDYTYSFTVLSSTPNGPADARITGTDQEFSCQGSSLSNAVTIDTVAPSVSVTGAPVSWQTAEATAGVSCLDSVSGCNPGNYRLIKYNSLQACSGNFDDYSDASLASVNLVSGYRWMCASAKDNAGNTGFSPTQEFKIDSKDPTATINDPPFEISAAMQLTLNSRAQDSESTVQSHVIKWNDGSGESTISCAINVPSDNSCTDQIGPFAGGTTVSYFAESQDVAGRFFSNSSAKTFTVCNLTSVSILPGAGCLGSTCDQGDLVNVAAESLGNCPVSRILQIDGASSDGHCNVENIGGNIQGISASCAAGCDSIAETWTVPSLPLLCRQKTIMPSASSMWKNEIAGTGTWFAGVNPESLSGSFKFGGLVNMEIPLTTIDNPTPNRGQIVTVTFNPKLIAPDTTEEVLCDSSLCKLTSLTIDGIQCFNTTNCAVNMNEAEGFGWQGNIFKVSIDTNKHQSDVGGEFDYGEGISEGGGNTSYSTNFPPNVTNVQNDPSAASLGQQVTFTATIIDPEGNPIISTRVCKDEDCLLKIYCDDTKFVDIGGGVHQCIYTVTEESDGPYIIYAEDDLGAINNSEGGTFIATDKQIEFSKIIYPDLESRSIGELNGKPVFPKPMPIKFAVNASIAGIECDNTVCAGDYSINGTPISSMTWDTFTESWTGEFSYGVNEFGCNTAENNNVTITMRIITHNLIDGKDLFSLKNSNVSEFKVKCEPTLVIGPKEKNLALGQGNQLAFQASVWDPQEREFDLSMAYSNSEQALISNWLAFECEGGCIISDNPLNGNQFEKIIVLNEKTNATLTSLAASKAGIYPVIFTAESRDILSPLTLEETGVLLIFAEGLDEFSNIQLFIMFILAMIMYSVKSGHLNKLRHIKRRNVNRR